MKKGRKIREIIVHCTDSPDDLDIGFTEINEWHRENGWLSPSGVSCGYHYIVRRDGRVQRGRPDNERGAHCKGRNTASIGIVWVGRNICTPEQYKSLLAVITGLRHQYNVKIDNVLGHGEIDHLKTCPNIDMLKLRGNLIFQPLDKPEVADRIKQVGKQSHADWA